MSQHQQGKSEKRDTDLVELFDGIIVERRFTTDWRKWSRIPVVSVREAIHLSLGLEPSLATPEQLHDLYFERDELAIANIGLGGALRVIPGSTDLRHGYVDINDARIGLATFLAWVLSNDMQLASNCPRPVPRAPKTKQEKEEGERQQATRSRANGILAFALAKRIGAISEDGKINVHRISETALESVEKHGELRRLGRSTLSKYIKEGLEILRGE